ncbi:PREDICTED: uncharacterized protein LOC105560506 [Vollenhovia emeryi]|uniref:uncharacterized protein LOC105560506 n=1 Tax=Vollenhovia emeryi TaxID=411798 RepID=UPI0005F3B717|nr:PREDICTED: uncharacterized protein LOC105560506 [Vollenhovia emeryi]
MESETSNQDYVNYNDFFNATVCHVCKRFGDDGSLMRCSGCKLISYCSPEHQKQHQMEHESVCNAVLDVTQTSNIKQYGTSWVELYTKKWDYIKLVSEKLGRPLELYENQMFLFPRECVVCYKLDGQSLKNCRDCAASYCKDHIYGIEHMEICGPLGLCFRLNLQRISGNCKVDHAYIAFISNTNTFENTKDFIKTYLNTSTDSEWSCDLLEAAHSPFITGPLTLFYAMRLLEYFLKRKNLVVHVVGANSTETDTLIGWGVLLYLLKLSSLTIVMVGPELNCTSYALPDFISQQKKCSFEFHDSLYENYVRSSSFVKPDIVVGFDAYIHQHELESTKETWAPSIRLIAEQNCPFVLTCRHNQQDLDDQAERINTILNRKTYCLFSGKNPFTCLRPNRVPTTQKVMYANNYVIVYQNLCP